MTRLLAIGVALVVMVAIAGSASAEDRHHGVHVAPATGGLSVGVGQSYPGHSDQLIGTDDSSDDDSPDLPVVVVDAGVDLQDQFCAGVNWTEGCVSKPPDQVAVTPGIVAAAFRRLPLPASELQVQPPNGRTLVNFDTNFYTENGEFTRTVTLLGRRVELRIWPARYGWRFGDGRQRWTTTPGDAYPHLEVTHRYLRKGRVSPSVDTTYAAQFRVNGGPWRDVNGTVTIPGTPQRLRVVTARPVLVGG
jgi:hypothetical protein